MIGNYEAHPVAEIFPMMSEKQFESFRDDIAENGVQEFGLLYQGMVLDGRNRYRACQEIGIEMDWTEVESGDDGEKFDPVQYVLSKNLHRRQLKDGQRAMIAAKMATLKNGSNQHKNEGLPIGEPSRDDAATLLSVTLRNLDRAKHVLAHGSKHLIEAVQLDDIKVYMAEKLCKAEPDKREQTRLVKEGNKAISLFLNPTPVEVEDTPISDDDEIGDKYEYPIVKMFSHCDYRLNTLKRLVESLESHEVSVLKDWLVSLKS